jgi:predicted CoA-binding protein
MAAEEIRGQASSVLVIDWPSSDVPDALATAGYDVYVKGGPEPDAFSIRELDDGEPVARPLGHAPPAVHLVYCHRPLDGLPAIVAMAAELGARALWYQSARTSDGDDEPTACWALPGGRGPRAVPG